MHGTTNIKFVDAQQAKLAYQYRNTKRKLYETNAAIWYNKICRQKRLTLKYINIRINDNRCYLLTCSEPAYRWPYTAYVLPMTGEIVTRNMYSEPLRRIKTQLLHLVGLVDYYKA